MPPQSQDSQALHSPLSLSRKSSLPLAFQTHSRVHRKPCFPNPPAQTSSAASSLAYNTASSITDTHPLLHCAYLALGPSKPQRQRLGLLHLGERRRVPQPVGGGRVPQRSARGVGWEGRTQKSLASAPRSYLDVLFLVQDLLLPRHTPGLPSRPLSPGPGRGGKQQGPGRRAGRLHRYPRTAQKARHSVRGAGLCRLPQRFQLLANGRTARFGGRPARRDDVTTGPRPYGNCSLLPTPRYSYVPELWALGGAVVVAGLRGVSFTLIVKSSCVK